MISQRHISVAISALLILTPSVFAQIKDISADSQLNKRADIRSSAVTPSLTKTVPSTGTRSEGSDNQSISSSDAGMQRPIFLRTSYFSFFGGVDNAISRKSNPLLLETEAEIDGSGGHDFTWSKTISAGLMSNPTDLDFGMLSFVAGGSWTKTDHLIEDFKALNDFATSAYALCTLQHESGWSYRIGSSYAMVRDIARNESYSEFYPNLGVSKSIDLGYDITGILDISGGKHLTTSDALAVDDKDTMENWDFAVSFGLRYQIWDFLLSPTYRYSKKVFTTDNSDSVTTFNRVDYSNTLSLKIDYSITESLSVGASYSFDQRESSVASNYKSWSADANMGLSLNF